MELPEEQVLSPGLHLAGLSLTGKRARLFPFNWVGCVLGDGLGVWRRGVNTPAYRLHFQEVGGEFIHVKRSPRRSLWWRKSQSSLHACSESWQS